MRESRPAHHSRSTPWTVREPQLRPRRARPVGVGLRPLQRAHRPARQPRRGRARGLPGHLPERLLRGAAAALRRGRLRLPGGRPDGDQRHQRQADPPAGRRRAVRRPLRRAARARARRSTCAPACWSARRLGLADRPSRPGALHAAGLVRAARHRRDQLTRSSRSTATLGSSCSRSSSRTRRCRRRTPTTRGSARRSSTRSSASTPRRRSCAPRWSTGRRRAACGWRRRWTTRSKARPAPRRPRSAEDDLGRVTVTADACAGPSRCGSSSTSPTAGRAGARCRRCATRSRRRSPRRGATGWDGLVAAPARVPRRGLGARRRRDRGRHRRSSRPSASGSSTRSRRAHAPSGARSPRRG